MTTIWQLLDILMHNSYILYLKKHQKCNNDSKDLCSVCKLSDDEVMFESQEFC